MGQLRRWLKRQPFRVNEDKKESIGEGFIKLPGELSFIAVNSSIVNITPVEEKRDNLREYLRLCDNFTDFSVITPQKSTTGNNVYYTIIPEDTPDFLPNLKQFVIGLVESLFPYNGLFDIQNYTNRANIGNKGNANGTTSLSLLESNSKTDKSSIETLIPNPYYDADHIASQIINKINAYDDADKDKDVYKADLALLIVKLYTSVTFLRDIVDKIESKRTVLNNILLKLQQNPIEFIQSPIFYQYWFINRVCTNFIIAYLNGDTAELAKITKAGEKKKRVKTKSSETLFADMFFPGGHG